MIAELAADLVAKVETIPALATSTGLSIGGRVNDPGLLKIPLPAAWIVMKLDNEDDDGSAMSAPPSMLVKTSQTMLATFAVTLFIPYDNDADLLAVQFPLLESVIEAIHGTDAASAGVRWRYIGQKIALVYPDRLAYEQRYTVSFLTNA